MTWAGYILGFPTDTPESIRRDIEIIKNELPIDILEFFCLTPLPGSEDHKTLFTKGVPMDPDMNKYDLEHVLTAHPVMSKAEWEGIYRDAWGIYYSDAHVETVLRRGVASGISTKKIVDALIVFSGATRIENVHPLQFGFVRRKVRTQRRHGLPIENPLVFYPRRAVEFGITGVTLVRRSIAATERSRGASRPIRRRSSYVDEALTPPTADEDDAAFRAGLRRQDPEDAWRAVARGGGRGERRSSAAISRRSAIPRRRRAASMFALWRIQIRTVSSSASAAIS